MASRMASRTRSEIRALAAGLGLLCAVPATTPPVMAHHAFAAEYDQKKSVEAKGVISKVEWTNPHMRVYVDVADAKGVVTTWNLELGSPNSVVRRGWTRRDLKVGDAIQFKAYTGRTVATRAVADSITLPDGRAFTGASGAPDAAKR